MIIKTITTIIVLVILYFTFEVLLFVYKYSFLPVLPAIEQNEKTLGSGPTLRFIAAGDSVGYGYGASSLEKTFNFQVAEFLAETNTVTYKNISVKGATTKDVLEKQVNDIIAYKPDVVTICITGNDITHLVSQNKIINNLKAIITKLEKDTSAKIYITGTPNFKGASILPWFYINFLEYHDKNLNKNILALEDERVKIVNIKDFGWSEEPYKDRSKTYAADNFHPNDLGYRNWTAAFLGRIRE